MNLWLKIGLIGVGLAAALFLIPCVWFVVIYFWTESKVIP